MELTQGLDDSVPELEEENLVFSEFEVDFGGSGLPDFLHHFRLCFREKSPVISISARL